MPGKRYAITMALACIVLLPACLTSTQATRLQTDLEEVKQQLFKVQQETSGSQQRLDTIDAKLTGGSVSPGTGQADLQVSIETLMDQIQALNAQIEEMKNRLTMLQMEIRSSTLARPMHPASSNGTISSSPSFPGQMPPAAAAAGRGPEVEAFNAAYTDYSKGNYELAVMGFADFLRANPEHVLAPDAQYWIGECLYSQGKFADAAHAFEVTVGRYPECDKVPAAMLKKGLAQLEMGQTSGAVMTLQSVIETQPHSEEALLAAEKLKQLGLRSP